MSSEEVLASVLAQIDTMSSEEDLVTDLGKLHAAGVINLPSTLTSETCIGLKKTRLHRSLPQAMASVETSLRTRERELDRLGRTPRATEADMRLHLLQVADRFQRLAREAVDGTYKDDGFFGDDQTTHRLRAKLRSLNRAFGVAIQTKGARETVIAIKTAGEQKLPASLQTLYADFPDPAVKAEADFQRELELLGSSSEPSSQLAAQLFKKQMQPWRGIAARHLGLVSSASRAFVERLLRHVTGGSKQMTDAILRSVVGPFFDARSAEMDAKLEELLLPYTAGFGVALEADFQEQISRGVAVRAPQQSSQALTLYQPEQGEQQPDSKVIDMTRNHYQMSLRTFTDTVINLAAESCLVRKIAEILTPKDVLQMSEGELRELADESQHTKDERDKLLREIEELRDVLTKCRKQSIVDLSDLELNLSALDITDMPANAAPASEPTTSPSEATIPTSDSSTTSAGAELESGSVRSTGAAGSSTAPPAPAAATVPSVSGSLLNTPGPSTTAPTASSTTARSSSGSSFGTGYAVSASSLGPAPSSASGGVTTPAPGGTPSLASGPAAVKSGLGGSMAAPHVTAGGSAPAAAVYSVYSAGASTPSASQGASNFTPGIPPPAPGSVPVAPATPLQTEMAELARQEAEMAALEASRIANKAAIDASMGRIAVLLAPSGSAAPSGATANPVFGQSAPLGQSRALFGASAASLPQASSSTATPSGFGTSSGLFGASGAAAGPSTGLGLSGGFGTPFGAPYSAANPSPGFGSYSASPFGGGCPFSNLNKPSAAGFGGPSAGSFGSTSAAANLSTGFGSRPNGLFGSAPAAASPSTGFGGLGGFGRTSSGLFGSANATAPSVGSSGGFGSVQAGSRSSFGIPEPRARPPLNLTGVSYPGLDDVSSTVQGVGDHPWLTESEANNSAANNRFMNICFLPGFSKFSPEEIRLKDMCCMTAQPLSCAQS